VWSACEIRLDEWRIGLPGIFQPGLAYGLSIIGLAQLPVTLEAMIFAIETPLILLLAWPLLGERPTGLLAALGLLAFAGVLILTWRPEIAVTSGEGFAVSLIVSAALFAALYSVIVRRMSADVDALRLTRASQTIGWLAVRLVGDAKAAAVGTRRDRCYAGRGVGFVAERNSVFSLWPCPGAGECRLCGAVAAARPADDRSHRVWRSRRNPELTAMAWGFAGTLIGRSSLVDDQAGAALAQDLDG
jgi:EamA-like transporter family